MTLWIPKSRNELRQHLNDPLFKNSLFIMLTSVSSAGFGFILWMLVARYYTPHDVGLATALISAANLLVAFSLFGFNFGILRFLPNEKDKEIANSTQDRLRKKSKGWNGAKEIRKWRDSR